MKAQELREKFLKYFEKNGHVRLPSSSLVPPNDPTLFFTNAGMVQFKDVFLGHDKRDYKRATTSQKCMRVSGKHNDLEQVGLTPRHHTFFEMLGNFSFGDYFKKEAIAYGWEFLTKTLGIPEDRLYITVFDDDDEAEKLWTKHVAKEKIFRMGEKDNFWAMGETGPCGPCSEIHFDRKPGTKVTKKDLETDRFMEIWNLVFMQFDRDSNGKMVKLAKPSIDTGMGLERLAAVVEGVEGNYETDLFMPIIKKIEKITGKKYGRQYVAQDFSLPSTDGTLKGSATCSQSKLCNYNTDFSIRVIADHIRAGTFLVGDGVHPSNEGRGYVLRRIIRRAIRHGKLLGLGKPFFAPIAHVVIDEMGSAYPELIQHRAFIEKVITTEEERFFQTLDKGLEILDNAFSDLKKNKKTVVPGDIAFKLYDTFGFPKDLTVDIASEHGMKIDEAGFEKLMTGQREMARAAWKGSGEENVESVYKELKAKGVTSKFVGYEKEACEGKVLAMIPPLAKGGEGGFAVKFITDVTPFYGESGGQIGDTGMAVAEGLEITITGAKKPLPDLIVHEGRIVKGDLKEGQKITLAIDSERRADIKRNHTATHLLHKALREALGEHVKQAGSYVSDGSLRFDFSHFQARTDEELQEVEQDVNEFVRGNAPVHVNEMSRDDAVKKGALAFFGEKYGARVRLVEVEGISMELCGGTHVSRSGDIGMLKILSESSVAAGIRRIEAVTGRGAEEYVSDLRAQLSNIASELKVGIAEVPARVKKLVERVKQLEKDIEKGAASTARANAEVQEINGTKTVIAKVSAANVGALRGLSDQFKQKIGSGVVVLAAVINDKVSLIVSVTPELTTKFNAGDIVKKLSAIVNGTGGGRPDMAQGGGADVMKIDELMVRAKEFISQK